MGNIGGATMKFEWEKPDGTSVKINDPNLITDLLNNLRSRIDTAKAEGRLMDEAALRTRYENQYVQWRWCMARFCQAQHHELERFIKDWSPVLTWWIEAFEKDGRSEQISDLQKSIFSDLSDDLRPTTWEEARKILDHHPYFKVPGCGLRDAIEILTTVMALANPCRDEAHTLSSNFFEGVIPDQSTLDQFHSRRGELKTEFNRLFREMT